MESHLEKLVVEIELRGLAESTKSAYLRNVSAFLSFHQKDPTMMGLKEIKEYLHAFQHLKPKGRVAKRSSNTVNGAASAVGFFFRYVLNKSFHGDIPRMKSAKTVPTVLSHQEVHSMINDVYNVLWKSVLMTLYTTGMRQSELRNLKITDIDNDRMVFYIRNAKGLKDRQALLSPTLLACLRTYWVLFRKGKDNSDYLFQPTKNSHNGVIKKPLSHTAVSYIVKRAAEIAGVKKKFILTV